MRKRQAREKLERIINQVSGGDTPGKIDKLYTFGPYNDGVTAPEFLGVVAQLDVHDPFTADRLFDKHYSDTLYRSLRGALKLTNNERVELVFISHDHEIERVTLPTVLVWTRTTEPWYLGRCVGTPNEPSSTGCNLGSCCRHRRIPAKCPVGGGLPGGDATLRA